MLTEHIGELRDWYESDKDVPEPNYDEVSLNSLADDLNIAYQAKSNVGITYWKNKRSEVHEGEIVELLSNEQSIRLKSNDCIFKLKLKHIIKVDIYD